MCPQTSLGWAFGWWSPILPAEALWVSTFLRCPSERAEHGKTVMLSALSLRYNQVKSFGHRVQAPEAQVAQGGHTGAFP